MSKTFIVYNLFEEFIQNSVIRHNAFVCQLPTYFQLYAEILISADLNLVDECYNVSTVTIHIYGLCTGTLTIASS